MIICTTPSLGFSPTLQGDDYPYTIGLGLPTPQVGSIVHVVDTDTDTGAHWALGEVSTDVYGWAEVEPEDSGGGGGG